MQNKRFEQEAPEFKERLVSINRVAKVVKGGRNFRFSALMVVGNENGRVGIGMSGQAWAKPARCPRPFARALKTPSGI